MEMLCILFVLALCPLAPLASPHNNTAPEPVSVMVIGVFHMSSPHPDLHNVDAGEILLPTAQTQFVL